MQLHFYGGAKSVTGANYLLEAGGLRIVVECGLFQGSRFNEELNYEAFPFDPRTIDCVLLTHSHTDHVGRLPKLYKEGFRGKVYMTEPTQGIIHVTLYDTFEKIKDEAAEMGHESLYDDGDVNEVLKLTTTTRYRHPVVLNSAVTATFREVSHILGSASVEIAVREDGKEKRIIFSGDVGNPPTPLLNPIDYPTNADYLVIESAYGNRRHEDRARRRDILHRAITETVGRKGVLMIPSFAMERTQELLLEIDTLFEAGTLPKVPIFVDSPLAAKISDVYGRFSHYFNESAKEILRDNGLLFQFPWLKITRSAQESKGINGIPPPKVIIAGSGMSQGGRILHHEARYLSDPASTILFAGYQVKGSLGRRIIDGEMEVKVLGQRVPVRCHVIAVGGYSAHADSDGLVEFARHTAEGGRLSRVFTVQGEDESARDLAQRISRELGVTAEAADHQQVVALP